MADNVIETEHLTKIFGGKHIAVNDVNLSVEQGTVYGFLGPNGAGKTTVVRLALGLIKPTAGSVKAFGKLMTPNSSDLRRRIGFLPTNPRFPPDMTPIRYLDFIGKILGMDKEERAPRLSTLLRAVDLLPYASKEIKGFSTGMTTRLGLAAALINDPELLILDEPTAGLDPAGRKSTMDLIQELGMKKTVFVSSHILGDIDRVCSHIGIINMGKLIFSGRVTDMKKLIAENSVQLELEGDIDGFRAVLGKLPEVDKNDRKGHWLHVDFKTGVDVLTGTSAVIHALKNTDTNVELITISTSTTKIEDAFLKLLEEEESDGFLRAVRK
jgi:ABC-2 type transport system ATP-binding protein